MLLTAPTISLILAAISISNEADVINERAQVKANGGMVALVRVSICPTLGISEVGGVVGFSGDLKTDSSSCTAEFISSTKKSVFDDFVMVFTEMASSFSTSDEEELSVMQASPIRNFRCSGACIHKVIKVVNILK